MILVRKKTTEPRIPPPEPRIKCSAPITYIHREPGMMQNSHCGFILVYYPTKNEQYEICYIPFFSRWYITDVCSVVPIKNGKMMDMLTSYFFLQMDGLNHLHPGKLTAGTWKSPVWKGTSSWPNLHFWVPCLIFPGCNKIAKETSIHQGIIHREFMVGLHVNFQKFRFQNPRIVLAWLNMLKAIRFTCEGQHGSRSSGKDTFTSADVTPYKAVKRIRESYPTWPKHSG